MFSVEVRKYYEGEDKGWRLNANAVGITSSSSKPSAQTPIAMAKNGSGTSRTSAYVKIVEKN